MYTLKDSLEENECPEDFKDLEVVYYAYWADYEESGKVIVFKFFNELMFLYNGYCVMLENNDFVFEPTSISFEQLLSIKEHWDKHVIYDNTSILNIS